MKNKIAIYKNTEMIKASGNAGRTPDGLFRTEDGNWLITFCHGNKYGGLSLQIEDIFFRIIPDEIRKKIKLEFGIDIPKKEAVFINPCYPKQVCDRYSEELKENKIVVSPSHLSIPIRVIAYNTFKKDFVRIFEKNNQYVGVKVSVAALSARALYGNGFDYFRGLLE